MGHLDSLLLAAASSTDNLAVGLSLGSREAGNKNTLKCVDSKYSTVDRKDISFTTLNLWIAICNASGAFLAAYGGSLLARIQRYPLLAPLLSAVAFGALALQELWAYHRDRMAAKTHSTRELTEETFVETRQRSDRYSYSYAFQLAIPMTLNNLAGGVAGGVAGISPSMTGLYALVVSLISMFLGHWIGMKTIHAMAHSRSGRGSKFGAMKTAHQLTNHLVRNPSLISAVLLGSLCLSTIYQEIL